METGRENNTPGPRDSPGRHFHSCSSFHALGHLMRCICMLMAMKVFADTACLEIATNCLSIFRVVDRIG